MFFCYLRINRLIIILDDNKLEKRKSQIKRRFWFFEFQQCFINWCIFFKWRKILYFGLLFNYKIFFFDYESSKSDCIDKGLLIGFIFGGLKVYDFWLQIKYFDLLVQYKVVFDVIIGVLLINCE